MFPGLSQLHRLHLRASHVTAHGSSFLDSHLQMPVVCLTTCCTSSRLHTEVCMLCSKEA